LIHFALLLPKRCPDPEVKSAHWRTIRFNSCELLQAKAVRYLLEIKVLDHLGLNSREPRVGIFVDARRT
jgi:hypothetical protein